MERIPLKKGNIYIYIGLLAAAILVMIAANKFSKTQDRSNTDRIIVGMQISPVGVCVQGDSLGGYYYGMVTRIAKQNNIGVSFDGFTQIRQALKLMDNGVYDIVIADFSSVAPESTDIVYYFDNQISANKTERWAVAMKDSAMFNLLNIP